MKDKDYIETTIVLYGDFDIQDNSQWKEWLQSMNGYMEKVMLSTYSFCRPQREGIYFTPNYPHTEIS